MVLNLNKWEQEVRWMLIIRSLLLGLIYLSIIQFMILYLLKIVIRMKQSWLLL